MNRIFKVSNNNVATDVALLVVRLGIAAFMLTHGIPKMMMLFSGAPVQFPPVMGLGAEISLALAVFTEVFCSLLIAFGLGTRLASLLLMVTMLVAVVVVHGADPFAKQEPALQYLLVYVLLLLTGSGRFSIDQLVHAKNRNAVSNNAVQKEVLAYQR